jgi:hypothetical protein
VWWWDVLKHSVAAGKPSACLANAVLLDFVTAMMVSAALKDGLCMTASVGQLVCDKYCGTAIVNKHLSLSGEGVACCQDHWCGKPISAVLHLQPSHDADWVNVHHIFAMYSYACFFSQF